MTLWSNVARTLVNIWVDDCSSVNLEGHSEAITHFEFLLMGSDEVFERAELAVRGKYPLLVEWKYEEELPMKAMLALKEGDLTAAATDLGNRYSQSLENVKGLMIDYRRMEAETMVCKNSYKKYFDDAHTAIAKAMVTLQNHIFKKKECVCEVSKRKSNAH